MANGQWKIGTTSRSGKYAQQFAEGEPEFILYNGTPLHSAATAAALKVVPQLIAALSKARMSIDVSLIRTSAKATRHWEDVARTIDAALIAAGETQ